MATTQRKEHEYHPELTDFGKWVDSRVRLLSTGGRTSSGIRETGYVQGGAYATAAIAKLKRSVGHDIGADPDIFEWTLAGLPEPDEEQKHQISGVPTAHELAAHTAITLFALHQQSIHEMSVHTQSALSLGGAVARLSFDNANVAGIRSRFNRIQTAGSWQELVHHARGLIALMKRDRIVLNYALFAQDLLQLHAGRVSANNVRMRWGKDALRIVDPEQAA
ncbi:type I-E CRISPR-associated protein Cse2/CasB [Bifidobacterium psychraerophilum]|uniref:type I-E CRISPR-associated protein Cse2/CasB n=1 Tax=Bifidobacterium psychraerophilum TaxID=218140 RepID=UPI0039EA21BE